MEKVLWDQNFWVVFMWVNREYHCVLVHFLYLLIVNLNKNYCLTFYTLILGRRTKTRSLHLFLYLKDMFTWNIYSVFLPS